MKSEGRSRLDRCKQQLRTHLEAESRELQQREAHLAAFTEQLRPDSLFPGVDQELSELRVQVNALMETTSSSTPGDLERAVQTLHGIAERLTREQQEIGNLQRAIDLLQRQMRGMGV